MKYPRILIYLFRQRMGHDIPKIKDQQIGRVVKEQATIDPVEAPGQAQSLFLDNFLHHQKVGQDGKYNNEN